MTDRLRTGFGFCCLALLAIAGCDGLSENGLTASGGAGGTGGAGVDAGSDALVVIAEPDDINWSINGSIEVASDPDFLPGATCTGSISNAGGTETVGPLHLATNCLGECGPGCWGILGTHYCTPACLAHDICVRCLGHANATCLALFAPAAQSWAQCVRAGGAGCGCPPPAL